MYEYRWPIFKNTVLLHRWGRKKRVGEILEPGNDPFSMVTQVPMVKIVPDLLT